MAFAVPADQLDCETWCIFGMFFCSSFASLRFSPSVIMGEVFLLNAATPIPPRPKPISKDSPQRSRRPPRPPRRSPRRSRPRRSRSEIEAEVSAEHPLCNAIVLEGASDIVRNDSVPAIGKKCRIFGVRGCRTSSRVAAESRLKSSVGSRSLRPITPAACGPDAAARFGRHTSPNEYRNVCSPYEY